MNKAEAQRIITVELAKYRTRPYDELRGLVDAPKLSFEVVAESQTRYYVDIRVLWDDVPEGDVRVVACIDDGGWRSYFPMADSFIKAPDGSFVDED